MTVSSQNLHMQYNMYTLDVTMCVCVCACMRACLRACVRACVHTKSNCRTFKNLWGSMWTPTSATIGYLSFRCIVAFQLSHLVVDTCENDISPGDSDVTRMTRRLPVSCETQMFRQTLRLAQNPECSTAAKQQQPMLAVKTQRFSSTKCFV